MYKIIVIFIALAIVVIGRIAGFEHLQNLIVLLVSNVLLDYYFEIFIASEKAKKTLVYGDKFNSDYFDLYWGVNKSSFQLLFNIIVFITPFSFFLQPYIMKCFFGQNNHFNWLKEPVIDLLVIIIAILVSEIIWIRIKRFIKNDDILNKLMMKKQQNYVAYTDDEIKMIRELK
ncbi:hypothetical protein HO543_06355 [Streptococcus suis]|nr:hypothetical protein [Streptococcus suis]NQJ76971.1 hypothetical protein [Streptococcus suis]